MKIIPRTRLDWLGFVLLPLKAYTVIAPSLFCLSKVLHPLHTETTGAEVFFIAGLFPCALVLLFTSLVLAIVGLKKPALSCALFGAAALLVGVYLLPLTASARA